MAMDQQAMSIKCWENHGGRRASHGVWSRPLFPLLLGTAQVLFLPCLLPALNLERLSSTSLSNTELLDVEYYQGHLSIPAGIGGTVIVDVRDPSNPVEVSNYSDPLCPYGRFYNTFFGGGEGRPR